MPNPNIHEAGLSTQFQPGQSGNPAGRPKGIKSWSAIVKKVLADEHLCDLAYRKKPGWFEKLEDKNFANAIVVAMSMQAAGGDVRAATWLRKTGFGDKLDITSDERPIIPLMVLDMGPPKPQPKPKAKPKLRKVKTNAGNKPKAEPGLRASKKPKNPKA